MNPVSRLCDLLLDRLVTPASALAACRAPWTERRAVHAPWGWVWMCRSCHDTPDCTTVCGAWYEC